MILTKAKVYFLTWLMTTLAFKEETKHFLKSAEGCNCEGQTYLCISQCIQDRILGQAQQHISCSVGCQLGPASDASACLLGCQASFYSEITAPVTPVPKTTSTEDKETTAETDQEPTNTEEEQTPIETTTEPTESSTEEVTSTIEDDSLTQEESSSEMSSTYSQASKSTDTEETTTITETTLTETSKLSSTNTLVDPNTKESEFPIDGLLSHSTSIRINYQTILIPLTLSYMFLR